MRFSISTMLVAGFAILVASANMACAVETLKLTATMTGANVIPANDSKAVGTINVIYDPETRSMHWVLEYSGLTGRPISAHFHGPAKPGEEADAAVPIKDLKSGSRGTAPLDDEQINALVTGRYYVDIHTLKHQDGEIRGQVELVLE